MKSSSSDSGWPGGVRGSGTGVGGRGTDGGRKDTFLEFGGGMKSAIRGRGVAILTGSGNCITTALAEVSRWRWVRWWYLAFLISLRNNLSASRRFKLLYFRGMVLAGCYAWPNYDDVGRRW